MQALIRHNLSSPSATAGVRDRMPAPTFNSRVESVCRNLDAADVCGAPEPLAAHVPSEKDRFWRELVVQSERSSITFAIQRKLQDRGVL